METIKKFKDFLINEGFDTKKLNKTQKEALDELMTSDLTILDSNDIEYYADKIGVSIEDLMSYIADSGMSNITTEEDNTVREELEKLIQNRLIDNPNINSINLMEEIEKLSEEIYMDSNDMIDNGDIIVTYDEIHDYFDIDERELSGKIKEIYDEMTYDPKQIKLDFVEENESVVRFNKFTKANENTEAIEDDKIEIFTGSHYTNKERNIEAFKKLNSLLLSDKNPLNMLFRDETLYLDDTNGLISIIHSSHATPHISGEGATELVKFIRDNLKYPKDVYIYIGDFVFH